MPLRLIQWPALVNAKQSIFAVMVAAIVAIGAATSAAQSLPADKAISPPWARGVSPERQQRAQALYEKANELVVIASVEAAVAKYREALEYWDHPSIRYNLAVVLMEMNRPIEAYGHIVASLQYGAEPLGAENYKRAMHDLQALRAGLTAVSIRSSRPGVEISLEGKRMLVGPGLTVQLIPPGQYRLSAEGGGFPAVATTHPMWPNRRYDIDVDPVRAIRRRWRRWIPWAVVAVGAGVSALGGVAHQRAQANFDRFDAEIKQRCRNGCTDDQLPPDLAALERKAIQQNRAAGALFGLGGSTVLAGAILLYLNRSRQVDREAFRIKEGDFSVSTAPMVSTGVIGIAAGGEF